MESCTGGLLASILTDVAGAADYYLGGLVTYQTQMKIDYGVPGYFSLEKVYIAKH